jgi:hypothetical protein
MDDPEQTDSMRAHWAKCQARAERFEEEVSLTLEEMGRTLLYFEWKRAWWLSLQSEREMSDSPPPVGVRHGLRAYAHRQANVYHALSLSFLKRWRKTFLSRDLKPDWLSQFPTTAVPQDHPAPETHPSSADSRRKPPPPSSHHLSPIAPALLSHPKGRLTATTTMTKSTTTKPMTMRSTFSTKRRHWSVILRTSLQPDLPVLILRYLS